MLLSDSFTFLLPYYAIGCAFYFLVEHWNLEVCIYFLTQASFTVGYGDLVPQYPLSRIFTAVYVPIGTVLHYGTALRAGLSAPGPLRSSPAWSRHKACPCMI